MLPRATTTRSQRESTAGKVGGRTQEIQRLIGRSLRAVTRLEEIGERTITLDCDVIQADGGTRTASITGAFVALVLALRRCASRTSSGRCRCRISSRPPASGSSKANRCWTSPYVEDSRADVDMNIVKTGAGLYIELQGTAEALPFGREALNRLLDLGDTGIRQLIALQRGLVGQYLKCQTECSSAPFEPPPCSSRRPIQERSARSGTAGRRPVTLLDLGGPAADRGARGNRRDLRGERAPQGALLRRAGGSDRAGSDPILAVAEDSGLVIDALDGEPGVRSARFLRPDATYPERFAEIYRPPCRAPAPHAPRASSARLPSSRDGQSSTRPAGRSKARSPSARAAAAGSATTRSSTTRPTRRRWQTSRRSRSRGSRTAARRSGRWRTGSPKPTE